MLWEAAQFRRRFFDLGDLPEQMAKIADLGDVNITFVPRTRRPGQQFTTTRRLRPGYDPEQVDAFLDDAEQRLAAMESDRTGQKDHWLAAPFSPMGRVGRLNKIFNHPRRGGATRRRRSTRSGKTFATRSSGSADPCSHRMRSATSGSGWPGKATGGAG